MVGSREVATIDFCVSRRLLRNIKILQVENSDHRSGDLRRIEVSKAQRTMHPQSHPLLELHHKERFFRGRPHV